jgi:hypothetical protein
MGKIEYEKIQEENFFDFLIGGKNSTETFGI